MSEFVFEPSKSDDAPTDGCESRVGHSEFIGFRLEANRFTTTNFTVDKHELMGRQALGRHNHQIKGAVRALRLVKFDQAVREGRIVNSVDKGT
jgi:hypothetical protein